MTKAWIPFAALSVAATAPALAACHKHKAKRRTEVCVRGWSGGYVLASVTETAAAYLVRYVPGAQLSSEWSPDADGDTYGNPSAPTRRCPAPGYVDNAQDCNDADASVNPDAFEVCGDGVDQNCNAVADDGCAVGECPCFSVASLNAVQADWAAEGWTYGTSTCSESQAAAYSATTLQWTGERYGNASANEVTSYYAIDYDESGQAYCSRFHQRYDYDPIAGTWAASALEDVFTPITAAQDAACRDVIYDFADGAGLSCL